MQLTTTFQRSTLQKLFASLTQQSQTQITCISNMAKHTNLVEHTNLAIKTKIQKSEKNQNNLHSYIAIKTKKTCISNIAAKANKTCLTT